MTESSHYVFVLSENILGQHWLALLEFISILVRSIQILKPSVCVKHSEVYSHLLIAIIVSEVQMQPFTTSLPGVCCNICHANRTNSSSFLMPHIFPYSSKKQSAADARITLQY